MYNECVLFEKKKKKKSIFIIFRFSGFKIVPVADSLQDF